MVNNNYFKLKKIKVTRNERRFITILVLLIGFIYFIIPLDLNDQKTVYKTNDVNSVLKSFTFPGSYQKQIVFEDKYANVIYENNGNIESHLINIEKKEEVPFNNFVKDEDELLFLEKEKELLLLKYPLKIVEVLLNSVKTYVFEDYFLNISYNYEDKLNTSRRFNLKIDYNEIGDYLEFATLKNTESIRETGFEYDPNKISVSFTFDDGPNGKKTQTLIDVLEDYKMSATFFMVANKLNIDQETVKKVYDSHSEIGYHSYKHEYFTRQSSEKIKEEFTLADNILYEITGGHFKLTRPPYGAYNTNVLDSIDNAFIRWDLDTNDWRYKDAEYIEKYVLDNFQDGSIILFHDTYQTSIDAAVSLIETLYLMDVQILNVSELANLKGITLDNHEAYYDFKK